MTTTPQAVTERYVSNLIHYGRNKEFDIITIKREESFHDGQYVGCFFIATTVPTIPGHGSHYGSGATISQAVRRSLEKHGVTFR